MKCEYSRISLFGSNFCSLDYEVKAPGAMLSQISENTSGPMAPIFATDVSSSGKYIAVFSADHNNAYIHIMDIDIALQKSAKSPVKASYIIPLQEGQFIIMQHVGIAISSDGTYVALYRQSRLGSGESAPRFPFHAFQLNYSPTMKLIEGSTIQQLEAHFVGYGRFLAIDKLKLSNEAMIMGSRGSNGDRFVAINKSRINVYDVGDNWKPLFGHNIGDLATMGPSRTRQLRMLHRSISGPQFVWMEDEQNVSVWDLETGANTKYISVNNPDTSQDQQDIISYLAVSPGGKLLALAGKDWVRTYFMDSCIEICKATIDDDGAIMNIEFIDQDKSLMMTIRKPSMDQTSIIMDAMNLSSWPSYTREFPSPCYTSLHIARTSNGQGKDGVMMAANWNMLEVYDIPQPVLIGGAPLVDCQGRCYTNPRQERDHGLYRLVVDSEYRRNGDQQQELRRVRLCIGGGLQLPIMTIIPEPWLDAKGGKRPVRAWFLSPSPQFIIATSSSFQVWNLPTSSDHRCELALSWAMPRSENANVNGEVGCYAERIGETVVCNNGKCATSTITINGTTTLEPVSIPKTHWFTPSETVHCINSFPLLASCYFDSSSEAQGAIIRYVVKHINHGPSGDTTRKSVMDAIALAAKWKCCSDILSIILGSIDGKWIPRCTPTMRIRDGHHPDNPISLLLTNADKDAYALSMAEQMMDYCIREANSQCDPAFLHPVSACLPVLVEGHHDIAIDVTRRSSFISVRNKKFIVDRATFTNPWRTWILDLVMDKGKRSIYEYQDVVFPLKSQLLSIAAGDFETPIEVAKEKSIDPVKNERFREKLYVAPYSLLWHYRDKDTNSVGATGIIAWVTGIIDWIAGLAFDTIMWIKAMASTKPEIIRKTIITGCDAAVIAVNTVNPLHKPMVRLNFRSRKYHESPAIAALIRCRW